MTAKELRKKYIDFFVKRGHKEIPSASLIPENDPTALFTSAGMHPLVPYLLGEPHPLGKRLTSCQKCLRTADIEKVGDTSHHTFFEMLGNWSLGDYFKKEQISWSYEFLTKELGLSPKRLSVSVFAGDKDALKDEESAKVWLSLKIPRERIYFFPKENNWWGPVGETGPCGPDTEIFYDTGKKPCGPDCRPEDGCGRHFEIWNDVFMEYNRTRQGEYEPLKQKNVDTGMGVERTVAVLQGKDDNYETELFLPIIQKIEELSEKKYPVLKPSYSRHDRVSKRKDLQTLRSFRVIVDHLRAATFAIVDGVVPSNKDRGYIIRRLIRRAVFQMYQLPTRGSHTEASKKICQRVIDNYSDIYPNLKKSLDIKITLAEEVEKFERTLNKGVKFLEKYPKLDGKIAFDVYQTYGIPIDVTQEIARQKGQQVKKEEFEEEFKKHQQLSRKGAEKKFAGGLADHSEKVTKLHTATHLLHQALREVLGTHVRQVGSNITPERLRFDFTQPEKLSQSEVAEVEKLVNEKIAQNLPVEMEIMSLKEAKKNGTLAFFEKKYGEKVKVYSIGDPARGGQVFSKEVCGGPHVDFTGVLGRFKIVKEESAGAGIRRIYARLE